MHYFVILIFVEVIVYTFYNTMQYRFNIHFFHFLPLREKPFLD